MKTKLLLLVLLLTVMASFYMMPNGIDRIDVSPTHPADASGHLATRLGIK